MLYQLSYRGMHSPRGALRGFSYSHPFSLQSRNLPFLATGACEFWGVIKRAGATLCPPEGPNPVEFTKSLLIQPELPCTVAGPLLCGAGQPSGSATHQERQLPVRTASWRSGYAEDCKSLYGGSIPSEASTRFFAPLISLGFSENFLT